MIFKKLPNLLQTFQFGIGLCVLASALNLYAQSASESRINEIADLKNPMGPLYWKLGPIVKNRDHLESILRKALDAEDERSKMRLLYLANKILEKNPNGDVSPQVFASLKTLLNDKKYITRYWAVKVLGRIPNKTALSLFEGALDHPDEKGLFHVQVIRAIGRTKLGDAILAHQINRSNYLIREAVCDTLRAYKTKSSLATLLIGLADEDVRVRSAAFDSLKTFSNGERFKYQPQDVGGKRNRAIKNWFDWIRNGSGIEFNSSDLYDFYKVPVRQIREEICHSIRDSKKPNGMLCLIWGLHDNKTTARKAAFNSLKIISQGKSFGYNPERPSGKQEKSITKWIDWVVGLNDGQIKKADWSPIYRNTTISVKTKILKFLTGVKTKSAFRCIHYGLKASSIEIRKEALKTLNVITGGKTFGYNPNANEDARVESTEKIVNWMKENKKEFSGF